VAPEVIETSRETFPMALLTLPDRPLKLSRKARPGYFWLLMGALFLIVCGVFLMVWQLPGLQRDWTISRNPVVVLDGEVQNGECTTRKGFFTDCEAHLSYRVDGQQYETEVAIMFADFHTGDYMVDIVRSGDNPALATMSIGVEKLWNRIIMLAILLLVTLGGGLALLLQGARNMRASGLLAQRGKMQAIPVAIETVQDAGRRVNVTFRDPEGTRPKAKFTSSFRKGEEPLILQTNDGGAFGVAVRHAATPMPVMLDRALDRLDLTADERAAAMASIGG
jgi:hypothetical protein